MIDQYDVGAGGLVIILLVGAAFGFLLRKAGLIAEKSTALFCNLTSAVIAAAAALLADVSPKNGVLSDMAGRCAIFAIVWVSVCIVFTFGFLIGFEKAEKK